MLVHQYEEVHDDTLSLVVERDLPPLIATLGTLLAQAEPPDSA